MRSRERFESAANTGHGGGRKARAVVAEAIKPPPALSGMKHDMGL